MKRIIAFSLFLIAAVTASAQAYYLNVYGKDGVRTRFAISYIDSVALSFEEDVPPIPDMQYVDLGLSVMWATCNIGAESPEGYGSYFAWGETEEKENYEWSNYKWGTYSFFSKYNFYSDLGQVDMKYRLDIEDDAAHALLGGNWRMPTNEEFEELIDNCNWETTELNGVKVFKVTSLYNGNSIYLPLSGQKYNSYIDGLDNYAYYFSNTLYAGGGSMEFARVLKLSYYKDSDGYQNEEYSMSLQRRAYASVIRPVYTTDSYENMVEVTSLALLQDTVMAEIGKEGFELDYDVQTSDKFKPGLLWSSSNEEVATVNNYGYVRVHGIGVCVITASIGDKTASCVVIINEAAPVLEYVDLGLSVEWATCNIGATSPKEVGNYYAWGETEVKDYYYSTTYKWYDAENDAFLKYNLNSNYGDIDLKYRLDPEDDVAFMTWGDGWRMPTNEEFQELIDNCDWTWINDDGYYGCVVRSRVNGNSIFLPATGYKEGQYLYGMNSVIYMSSSMIIGSTGYYTLYCLEDHYLSNYYRFSGYTVRAVHSSVFAENTISVSGLTLDEQNVSVEVGQQKKLNYSVDADTLVSLSWISDNPSVARVASNGTVLGMAPGECTLTASIAGLTQTCTVTVTEAETVKEWVDLGLSVKWATTNVGASRPEYAGGHYAWGETVQKEIYDWEHHAMATYEGDSLIITKYNEVDGLTTLEPDDDVAHVLWGDNWRMPTTKEYDELLTECEWTRTKVDGITGYEVTGPNGNSIFLPVSGYMYNSGFYASGPYYYTSTAHGKYSADYLYPIGIDYLNRAYGFPVRPVKPYSIDELDGINLNRKSLRLMEGNTYKLEIRENISDAVDAEWISTDESVVTVQDGLVTALGLGTANVIVILDELKDTCVVTVADPEYVNLGLSVNWATLNIGAYSPEESGNYYAWGETETKSDYSWSTYKFGDEYSQTKYSVDVDGKTVLDPEDDVAHVLWGSDWRMPTVEEFNELIEMCSWELTTINGMKGYIITSEVDGYEDNYIFLPLSGYQYESSVKTIGQYGDYWTSSKSEDYDSPYELYMGQSFFHTGEWEKYVGLTIRPVCKNNTYVDKVMLSDNVTVLVDETVDGEKVYKVAPRIIADPADSTNLCIVVTAIDDPESYHDAQLFITISDSIELEMGDILKLSFKYKADGYCDATTEIHSVPGQWVNYSPEDLYFTPRWQEYSIKTTVEDPDQRTFVVNLEYSEDCNNFYFDNIMATISYPGYQPDGFNLSPYTLIMEVGEYGYLNAYDNAGYPLNQYTQWVSTNDSVAVVNDRGEVYSTGEGTCYIVASFGDYTDTCEVIVKGGGSTFMPGTSFYLADDSTKCVFYYVDDNGYGQGAQADFRESDDSIVVASTTCTSYVKYDFYPTEKEASAEYEQMISGLNKDEIETLGISLFDNIIIRNVPEMIGVDRDSVISYMRQVYDSNAPQIPDDDDDDDDDDSYISLNISELHFRVGGTFHMYYYTNSQEEVSWESTNDSVAVVDQEGVVTGVGIGSCFIVVSAGDMSDSCLVNVRKQYIDSVQAKYDFIVADDSLSAMFYYSTPSFCYELSAEFGVDSTGALVCVDFGITMTFETAKEAQDEYEDMTSSMPSEKVEFYGFALEDNVITYTSPETIGLGIGEVLTMMRQSYNEIAGKSGQSEYQEAEEG